MACSPAGWCSVAWWVDIACGCWGGWVLVAGCWWQLAVMVQKRVMYAKTRCLTKQAETRDTSYPAPATQMALVFPMVLPRVSSLARWPGAQKRACALASARRCWASFCHAFASVSYGFAYVSHCFSYYASNGNTRYCSAHVLFFYTYRSCRLLNAKPPKQIFAQIYSIGAHHAARWRCSKANHCSSQS